MAEPLLDRIHSDLRARVRELEPAVREYQRLEVASAALDGLTAAQPVRKSAAEPPATSPAPSRSTATSRRRSTGPRAPRGANRAAVLRVLEERPGVSVSELATAAGVGRTVLYSLLRTLQGRGEVAREQLPGGATGYRLAPQPTAEPATVAPEPTADDAA